MDKDTIHCSSDVATDEFQQSNDQNRLDTLTKKQQILEEIKEQESLIKKIKRKWKTAKDDNTGCNTNYGLPNLTRYEENCRKQRKLVTQTRHNL